MTPGPFRNLAVKSVLLVSSIVAPAAFASQIFEPTATLPPPDGIYTQANTCIPAVCLTNIVYSNFVVQTDDVTGPDELTHTTAKMSAFVYTNNGGNPGAFINPVLLTGTIDFKFLLRTNAAQTGSFNADITALDLTGTFNGLSGLHTAHIILNGSQTSSGQVSVTALASFGNPQSGAANQQNPDGFRIDSFFDVFTELSLDNGPFVIGPARQLDLAPTPEPASGGLAVAGFLSIAGLIVRRGRR